MTENLIFETMETALSGAQHAEEITAGLIDDIKKVECGGAAMNTGIYREGLFSISETIDAIETLLYQAIQVRSVDRDRESRLNEIEEAARRISLIQRPEMPSEDPFANIPDGLDEDLPFQDDGPEDNAYMNIPEGMPPGIEEDIPPFPNVATIAIENTTNGETMIVCMNEDEGALIMPGDFLEIQAPVWGTVWTAETHEEKQTRDGIQGHFKVLDRRPEWLPEDATGKASFIRAREIHRSPLPY